MPSRLTQQRPKTLQIMQANVGRKSSAHETALNLAYEGHIDIVLIQEPSIRSQERRLTRTHPAYETFAPIDNWVVSKPRVMTYIRFVKGLDLEGSNTNHYLLHLQTYYSSRSYGTTTTY